MNFNGKSLADIWSARQLAEVEESNRTFERAERAENMRKRRVGEATIELNERTKQQNEIVKAQLAEAQKANELLVKQATDSARTARISQWIAIVSLIVSIASIVIMLIV